MLKTSGKDKGVLMMKWCAALKMNGTDGKINYLNAVISAGFGLFFFALNYISYRSFTFPWTEDLGIFNQIFFHLVNDFTFTEHIYQNQNFLSEHFFAVSVLLAPFYSLYQDPLTIIFWGILCISLSGYFISVIALEHLENRLISTMMLLIFFLNPSIVYLFIGGFRFSILAMLFLTLALLFYTRKRFCAFLISCVLAVLCKEDIGLSVFLFGFLALVQKRGGKWIASPLILGGGYFYGVNGVIMPLLNPGNSFAGAKFNMFYHLGQTPEEIIKFIILNPVEFLSYLGKEHAKEFYKNLLEPLGYMPLVGMDYLLVPLGGILTCVLPIKTFHADIRYWYQAPVLPFLFVSVVMGMERIANVYMKIPDPEINNAQSKRSRILGILTVYLILSTLMSTPIVEVTRAKLKNRCLTNSPFHTALDSIPKDAVVAAQFPFIAYLSSRERVLYYPYHQDADYIVLNPNKNRYPLKNKKYNQYYTRLLSDPDFYRVYQDGKENLILKRIAKEN